MKTFVTALSTAVVLSGAAQGASVPVDLTGWIENGYPNNSAGNWSVQSGNDSVVQSINGEPTVFFNPGGNAQGTELSGTIRVNGSFDDDFIGFVLGYQDGEINSTSADFWLVDWKQGNQSGAPAGLALSHVSGDLTNTSTGITGEWWLHNAPITEVARATNLGTTGWLDFTEYSFDLTFTDSLIAVAVGIEDGAKSQEISFEGNFTDGAFGFYNFSQSAVEYAGITSVTLPAPVPLPAGLPLLLAGMGAFALIRRRAAS